MASEPVRIERYLHAADTSSTLEAIRTLGALVEVRGEEVVVRGTGLREAREPEGPIDVGNAGTLLRLLPGWLAAQEGRSFTLDGDESIRRRPVDRIAEPLRLMGAELEARERAPAPARSCAARDCGRSPTSWPWPAPRSSRACCWRRSRRTARRPWASPPRSRDHTERMLLRAGVGIHRNGRHVTVVNTDELLLDERQGPRRPQLGGVPHRGRGARARLAPAARGCRA